MSVTSGWTAEAIGSLPLTDLLIGRRGGGDVQPEQLLELGEGAQDRRSRRRWYVAVTKLDVQGERHAASQPDSDSDADPHPFLASELD